MHEEIDMGARHHTRGKGMDCPAHALAGVGEGRVSRREFVRTATLGAAALAASPRWARAGQTGVPETAKVLAVHHKDVCPIVDEYQPCDPDVVKAMVKDAVLRMGMGRDMGEVVRGWCPSGKTPATARVKIKFCGTRGRFPVHAGVVNGVVRLLVEQGGVKPENIHVYENCPKNFGEEDRGPSFGTPFGGGKNREPGVVYSHLGAPDGVDMAEANSREELRVDLGDGQVKEYGLWLWDALAKDTDILINIPALKRHISTPQFTTVTGAMKNHYGSLRNPSRHHGPEIGEQIAAVNMAAPIRTKQRLIVMDALYAMYTRGPDRGRMKYGINKLLVARDPVAVDYVAFGMLDAIGRETPAGGFEPFAEPREIAIGARNGVGVRGARWQDHVEDVDLA